MALIKCQECGGQVSDTAVACPHCGASVERQIALQRIIEEKAARMEAMKRGKPVYCRRCGKMAASESEIREGKYIECSYCNGVHTGGPTIEHSTLFYDDFLKLAKEDPESDRDPRNPDIVNDWIVRHILRGNGVFEEKWYQIRLNREKREENPEYVLWDRERRAKAEAERQQMAAKLEASTPKCPNCQSTNINRIGAVSRGASVAMFGLFSSKIGKTYECRNCGYKW